MDHGNRVSGRVRLSRRPALRVCVVLLAVQIGLLACSPATTPTQAPLPAPDQPPRTDNLLIEGGTVYDGLGKPGVITYVAINGDRIAGITTTRPRAHPRASPGEPDPAWR